MALRLISLNVEWDRHLETVLPFLEKEKPDAVILYELTEKDIPLYEKACGPCAVFAREGYIDRNGTLITFGTGIFSRVSVRAAESLYYFGSAETIRVDTSDSDWGTHVVASAIVGEEGYRIAGTHFTWTPNGEPNDDQRRDLPNLIKKLDSLGEFVLAGDFNAPRGKATFAALAERYKDNIPSEYETSIDVKLHKTRDNPVENARVGKYVVDGIFTTPGYKASDVRFQFGVSDHAAIVATIEKAA